jgi:hypothetical protein
MKKFLYLLSIILSAFIYACDDLDRLEDRYIPMPHVDVKRKVLLEEFTGQRCVNCPTAHLVVNDLKQQYGESVIAVGIHATSAFGLSETMNTMGLMNAEGDAYAAYWNAVTLPTGMINRTSGLLDYDKWAAYVRTELEKEPKLKMHLTAKMDTLTEGVDSLINITVDYEPIANIDGKIQIWITENEITAPQMSGSSYILDYQHNHVFRAHVNGTWGTDVYLLANILANQCFTHKIKKHWNRKNLRVVAFVYNETEGVLQVEECPISFSHNIENN